MVQLDMTDGDEEVERAEEEQNGEEDLKETVESEQSFDGMGLRTKSVQKRQRMGRKICTRR